MENQKKSKLSEKRNEKIYQEFENLFNDKGLRIDVIYNKLSERYFISASRIGKIVVEQAKKIRELKEIESK
ncbi:MAG: hypothetical protein KKE39_05455 [Bacteroidetes bacterium]|nr:hypothetical protein [Bacteroidota bacterium]MBU1373846.1 hypothetical protein [Bacteroidota bacterium]MBU1483952.1 hypothetical protein [Bacteroidota bacterium]MBU1761152.1 hypothetical protein [Bacteroidota bacterium]MBU2268192.1 hypothetical protein [Bacteroidota bacterium]